MDLDTVFYDLIFGGNGSVSASLSTVEQDISDKVEDVLSNSAKISTYVPALPKVVTQLIAVLRREDLTFSKISEIIGRDVKLTVEVVRLANSPYYLRTLEPLESLEHAVRSIGLERVSAIATTAVMKNLLWAKPLYFKWFGQLIWTHSLECAVACQYLSGGSQPFLSYLLGLIHDVGKIVIFRCLLESVEESNLEEIPNSKLFKSIMTEHSLWFSVLVAEEWQLPKELVKALKQQESKPRGELAQILYLANLSSEIHLLIQSGKMTSEEGVALLAEKGMPEPCVRDLFDLMSQVDSK